MADGSPRLGLDPGLDPLRTERLIGRPLTAEHLGDLNAMGRDPRVMATLGGLRTEEDTRRRLAADTAHWLAYGFGLWAFYERDDRSPARDDGGLYAPGFVGRGGLRKVDVDGVEEVEIAYALRAEHWGRGLATEIALACCEVGFGTLGFDELVAFALPDNRGSRRVMEKAGLVFEGDLDRDGVRHVLYRRRRTESP